MSARVIHKRLDEQTDQFTCGDHRIRVTRGIGDDGSVDITYTRKGPWGRFRGAESTIIPGTFLAGDAGDVLLRSIRGN